MKRTKIGGNKETKAEREENDGREKLEWTRAMRSASHEERTLNLGS